MQRSPITTHILDTSKGSPAAGVAVMLEKMEDNGWQELGSGKTNEDGRVTDLLPEGYKLVPGIYRLIFDTSDYFQVQSVKSFYPYVPVTFEIVNPDQHYHVPLLLSPFGYSTYRGS